MPSYWSTAADRNGPRSESKCRHRCLQMWITHTARIKERKRKTRHGKYGMEGQRVKRFRSYQPVSSKLYILPQNMTNCKSKKAQSAYLSHTKSQSIIKFLHSLNYTTQPFTMKFLGLTLLLFVASAFAAATPDVLEPRCLAKGKSCLGKPNACCGKCQPLCDGEHCEYVCEAS